MLTGCIAHLSRTHPMRLFTLTRRVVSSFGTRAPGASSAARQAKPSGNLWTSLSRRISGNVTGTGITQRCSQGRPNTAPATFLRFRHCERRSEEHTSELQSQSNLVCRLLLEKKKKKNTLLVYIPLLVVDIGR